MFSSIIREIRFRLAMRRFERVRQEWRRKHLPLQLREAGFTLLELMIVVGIVAVIAALALPAYANYSTKAAASEGIRLAESAMTSAVSSYQDSGTWPLTNQNAGYAEQTGKYASVQLDGNGNVAISYNGAQAPAALAGTLLYMQGWLAPDGQTVVWTCGNIGAPPNFPATASSAAGPATALGAGGPVSTTPVQYLPRTCHT